MDHQFMSPELFARLGGGEIAYVKPMTSDAFDKAFPNVADLAPGLSLWALVSADGTPIVVTDSREAAVQNAWDNDLETVSLH